MLRDQRMQPGDAFQALRQPSPSQAPPVLVEDLDVVMVFGPVVTYPDHLAPPTPETAW